MCTVEQVVCRQLGFTGGTALSDAHYGQGSGYIWLRQVGCSGSESSLMECLSAKNQLPANNILSCFHYEDAAVECTGNALAINTGSKTLDFLHGIFLYSSPMCCNSA